ncbi:AAEL003715-PA [Aedes aegypti]|nr:AAEL003715-PA [Aedes aegypti]
MRPYESELPESNPEFQHVPERHSNDIQRQTWGQLEPPKQKPQQQPPPQKPQYVSPYESELPDSNSEFQQKWGQWLQQQQTQREREPEMQAPPQNVQQQIQNKPQPQRQKPKPQNPQFIKPIDVEDFGDQDYSDQPKFHTDVRCPRIDNAKKPVHLPVPGNCSKFIKCFEGLAYEQNCPAGLEFGVSVNRCDYPAKAKCSINNGW